MYVYIVWADRPAFEFDDDTVDMAGQFSQILQFGREKIVWDGYNFFPGTEVARLIVYYSCCPGKNVTK